MGEGLKSQQRNIISSKSVTLLERGPASATTELVPSGWFMAFTVKPSPATSKDHVHTTVLHTCGYQALPGGSAFQLGVLRGSPQSKAKQSKHFCSLQASQSITVNNNTRFVKFWPCCDHPANSHRPGGWRGRIRLALFCQGFHLWVQRVARITAQTQAICTFKAR